MLFHVSLSASKIHCSLFNYSTSASCTYATLHLKIFVFKKKQINTWLLIPLKIIHSSERKVGLQPKATLQFGQCAGQPHCQFSKLQPFISDCPLLCLLHIASPSLFTHGWALCLNLEWLYGPL